jgi:hypothetical protein
VLVEVANELYGVEVAYELHKNLSNGAYVTENNPLNYKKLKEDFWVKNKESGNVYTVKNQNPEIHTEPSKDEIEAAKKDKSANTDNTQSSEPTSYIGAAARFGNRVLTKVKNWTRQEKEYFQKGYHKPGSEQRRSIATAFKDKLKGAWKAVKDGLKHEVHTFKTAAVGVFKFFKREKLNDDEKKAIKTVVKHVAVTALMAFAGGGLAHGAAAFAKHVAIELVPHVVAETILVGVGRAAVFADADSEAETDLNFQKFGEMVADGLENMEISPEQMEAMVDSYEEKKKSGEIKIKSDTDQTPPTKETPEVKPEEEEEDPLQKDLDSVKFGMMTGAEKEAYLKKKREKSDSLEEDVWVKNIKSGNVYTVKKANPSVHTPPSKDEIEKVEKEKSNGSGDSKSKQTQKIADNLKGRKDSDGNTLDAETTNNGSLILGVEHGEGTESTQQSIKQIQSLPKDTKVMFVGEGGMTRDDNGNLELAGEQAEFRDATREHFSNWEESSWDENANVYDGDSPVYDSVAQSLGGSKSKAFAAVWSNMVGQGDDMNADDYLDDEGKEWLINQAKKGGSKEFDGDVDWNNLTKEQVDDLYELNFRDNNRLGETEISKSQEAYNNFRQKELDRKIKEAEDAGYTVIAPVGNSHVDLWRQRNKPKTESILRKIGISNWEFTQLLKEFSLISEVDDIDMQSVLDSKVLNPDTNRQIKVSTGLGYDKASGGYQAAKAKMADSGISDEETEKVEKEKTDDDEDSKSNSNSSNSKFQSEMKDEQEKLEKDRDMGAHGAGTAVASYGEARYCNTMNTHNEEKFKKENRQTIDAKKEEFKNEFKNKKKPWNKKQTGDLEALGLDPNSDEAYEYIATREIFADKELERMKGIEGSVYHQEPPNGFGGDEEACREWSRAAYDGALATRKILEEDTTLDTSKPHTTVQSTPDTNQRTISLLENKLNEAKKAGDKKLIEHYEQELYYFNKNREYHDTFVIGEDKDGNITIVSVSNKKSSELNDTQGNTTPAKRFGTMREQFGETVAKTVVAALDNGIEKVSNVKKATIKRANDIEISDSMAEICDTPEMKTYMNKLRNDEKFKKYLEGKGFDVNKLSTKELLVEMQNHSRDLIAKGKTPKYEPYGKIYVKVAEFAQKGPFQKRYPNINSNDESVNSCKEVKNYEKNVVNEAHAEVVNEIKSADEKEGYPKNGINGPNTQAYLGGVMDSMHADSYIDGGDGRMIVQMGIRGAQPQHIRECFAEQTGFKGDTSTKEGREALKKHMREKCTIDSESGAIIIKDENGTRSIFNDTWRTAGSGNQKVASGYGDDMRKCVKSKVDAKRRTKQKK